MRNFQTLTTALVAAFAIASLAPALHAATIQSGDVIKLDFSTAGDSDGGSLADWNQTDDGTSDFAAGTVIRHGDSAVVDGVTIGFTNEVAGNFGNDGNAAGWNGTAADPYYILAADDIYFHGSAADMTVTFGGLNPNLRYNVRLYLLIGNNGGTSYTYSVTDGAGTQGATTTNASRWAATTLEAAGLVFSDLEVNASNEVVATVSSPNFFAFNALVVEAVPAPAALPAGLAMLGLVAARRRRK